MATLTQEEIEQKKRLLKEKMDEMHAIYVELMEAGAYPLDDDELDGIAGGVRPGSSPGPKQISGLSGYSGGVHFL